jgi:hypothetical protein
MFARWLSRIVVLPAVLWFSVMAVQLLAAVLDVDLKVPLPSISGAAFLAANYLMIRLLARRIAGEQ